MVSVAMAVSVGWVPLTSCLQRHTARAGWPEGSASITLWPQYYPSSAVNALSHLRQFSPLSGTAGFSSGTGAHWVPGKICFTSKAFLSTLAEAPSSVPNISGGGDAPGHGGSAGVGMLPVMGGQRGWAALRDAGSGPPVPPAGPSAPPSGFRAPAGSAAWCLGMNGL